MKSSKRNMTKRAFSKGYYTGHAGKPKTGCPHFVLQERQAWLNGWRAGWVDRVEGKRFSKLL